MIKNVKTEALFDTGAETSCIFEDFYNKNVNVFEKCPKLPVTGKIAISVFGEKTNKVKI